MHDQPDQIALRVGDDMPLAALDLLACVIAPRAAALRGSYRLAVNHSGRQTCVAANRLARRHDESVVERGKRSVGNHNWLKSLSFFFSRHLGAR